MKKDKEFTKKVSRFLISLIGLACLLVGFLMIRLVVDLKKPEGANYRKAQPPQIHMWQLEGNNVYKIKSDDDTCYVYLLCVRGDMKCEKWQAGGISCVR